MSSHADTIRLAINAAGAEGHLVAGAWDALDALLAENKRLREALEAFFFEYDSGKEYAGCAPSDPVEQKMREALAGDTE